MTKYTNISIKSLFTFLIIILFINIGNTQSKKKNPDEIKSKLWYGINMGNIGISNNSFYTNLSLMGGYKITKEINIGAIVHGYYTYLWSRGNNPNDHIFDYGYGALANAKFYRNYFFQVEVDQMYLTQYNISGDKIHNPYLFTYIGGGYKYNNSNKWSFIITILYNVNPDSNQEIFPLDYRGAFVYNF